MVIHLNKANIKKFIVFLVNIFLFASCSKALYIEDFLDYNFNYNSDILKINFTTSTANGGENLRCGTLQYNGISKNIYIATCANYTGFDIIDYDIYCSNEGDYYLCYGEYNIDNNICTYTIKKDYYFNGEITKIDFTMTPIETESSSNE